LHVLIFDHEDGGDTFLQDVGFSPKTFSLSEIRGVTSQKTVFFVVTVFGRIISGPFQNIDRVLPGKLKRTMKRPE
jgi:hypothetical protein